MARTDTYTHASVKTPDGRLWSATSECTTDWDSYSAKHGHGPKRTEANRRVTVLEDGGDHDLPVTVMTFDRWPRRMAGISFNTNGYAAILKAMLSCKCGYGVGDLPPMLGSDVNFDVVLRDFFAKGARKVS